ncbi:DUF4369 domain-containing protein [Seonamhaeicola maritimus]|uniref:DUF4369 domain-containing protein n=1 Tax=Seonamhaeicola maritimus TaxID=2591822 RepID=A0A5C7GFC9_9FLAO|nr:DUF4369 domain-containing protein [Seonamhaeicola maritimus]TXG35683.1 DUF4369 domain-containing protein [Seonamhaeicola maritimus]
MKKIALLFIALFIIACGEEKHDLVVKTHIKGLKKGTVYLKKVIDTSLVTVDSMVVNGNPQFELYSDLESPEVFFLYLDKNSSEEDRITFFADKGITEINTTLKRFVFDAEINGSEQQKTLEEYRTVISKLNTRNLEIIKENFEAQKDRDTAKLSALEKEREGALRRKYLFTVNFALNNKDSEVAPYLALTEVYNAKVNLLDTINNSLTPKVKESKYGKQLNNFIKEIKEKE